MGTNDASIERSLSYWKLRGDDGNWSDDDKTNADKRCYECHKTFIAISFIREHSLKEESLKIYEKIPDDLPFLETNLLILIYSKCAFVVPPQEPKSQDDNSSSKNIRL